ncbi:hypothetical protein, partial [Enterobacter ludwigii]|uniref:hypothetical protein n=1 Tax=Enterobacter ludwigii TaxID=299767 RepID=UPI0009BACB08
MKRSDVPAKHALPFALNGSRNAIPESGAAAGIATLTSGFPDETMQPIIAGGIPPDGKDMNGVLFELSAMGRWANAGAEYAWDETFSDTVGGYPLGARLLGSDGQTVFISMQDDNTTNPETVSAAWVGYNPGRSSLVLTSGIRTLTALEAAGGMVVLTGTLTGNMQLVFPAWVRQWDVINQTTGAYTVTCRTDTGGVQVLQGYVTRLYGDGRILNAWAAREVAGMVKSVNGHAPGVNGDVKLGSAADADIVTSMTDTTAGRATVVGWMGTGGPEIPIPDGTDIYKYFA